MQETHVSEALRPRLNQVSMVGLGMSPPLLLLLTKGLGQLCAGALSLSDLCHSFFDIISVDKTFLRVPFLGSILDPRMLEKKITVNTHLCLSLRGLVLIFPQGSSQGQQGATCQVRSLWREEDSLTEDKRCD